ncbi:hypothetical protein [Hungatella hathewayi]|nr:hypothetical protein [Hungatella hathewayi]
MKKQVNPIISIASIMAAPANGSMHAINGSTDGTAANPPTARTSSFM